MDTSCKGNKYIKPGSYSIRQMGDGKVKGRHVYEWELVHGPVPDGLEIDHLCGNRWCYEVTHLEAVSHAENCRRGVHAKLTWEDVELVRNTPPVYGSNKMLATRLGVSTQTISDIRAERTWVK